MKKLILLYAILIGFTAVTVYGMEQDEPYKGQKEEEVEESKVPTLQELALQKAATLKDVKLSLLPEDIHNLMNIERFLLCKEPKKIANVEQFFDYIGEKKIPELFFKLFMKCPIVLNVFADWIKGLSIEKKDSITRAFSDKIKQFMTQKEIVTIELFGKNNEQVLIPIDFIRSTSAIGQDILAPLLVDIPIQGAAYRTFIKVDVPEIAIPFFVGQQIQQIIIDHLVDLKNTKKIEELIRQGRSDLINNKLEQKLGKAVRNVMDFITSKEKAYPGKTYSDLQEYFARLLNVFFVLSNVTTILYRDYEWDNAQKFHKRSDKGPTIYRIKTIE